MLQHYKNFLTKPHETELCTYIPPGELFNKQDFLDASDDTALVRQ